MICYHSRTISTVGLPLAKKVLPVLKVILSLGFWRQSWRQCFPKVSFYQINTDAPTITSEPACSLVWRTTSRAEDETLAIAGLVNVDAREYLHMNG